MSVIIQRTPYDVVGVGFGPANLALAAAIDDKKHITPLRSLFIEQKKTFAWHPGMMLKDSYMQTPFLKDLVTIDNPQSKFSFLNFLKQVGRLEEFINIRRLCPSRAEFEEYLQWAAEKLTAIIMYDTHVTALLPKKSLGSDTIDLIEIQMTNKTTGIKSVIYAKNVVLGIGLTPNIKKYENQHCNIFHSGVFLHKVEKLFPDYKASYSFVVIGSGQSAAEIIYYLLVNFPNATINSISRSFMFRAIDDNSFVNTHYSGQNVTSFFTLHDDSKNLLLSHLNNTNYSVVDYELIEKIAEIRYNDIAFKKERLILHSFCELEEITEQEPKLLNLVVNNILEKRIFSVQADGVCFCTGYDDSSMKKMIYDLAPYFNMGANETYAVSESYQINTNPEIMSAALFLQGYSRVHHGFTEGTIANLAIRSQVLLRSIIKNSYKKPENNFSLDIVTYSEEQL